MKALLIMFLLTSCKERFTNDEMIGTYVPIGYKNNLDTIQIKPQGLYHRRVFDKTNKLVLEMEGTWKLVTQNSQIQIEPFYLNLDDDLVKFPDNVRDTSMVIIKNLETQNGTIQFCVGYYEGENCYRKIK
jgi:hypothetical protein